MVRPLTGPAQSATASPFTFDNNDLSFFEPGEARSGDQTLWLADDQFPSHLLDEQWPFGGAHDSAASWNYFNGLSQSDGSLHSRDPDDSQSATPQAVALVEEYEIERSHASAADFFANSKPGGGGGGGGGGAPKPYSYTHGGITLNVSWDSSVGRPS